MQCSATIPRDLMIYVEDTVACLSKADTENVFFSDRKWQGVEIYFSLNSRGWFGFVFSIQ